MARPELGRDRGQLRPRLERPLLRVAPLRIVDSLLGRIDVNHPPDDGSPEHLPQRLRRLEPVSWRNRHPPGSDRLRAKLRQPARAESPHCFREQPAQFLDRLRLSRVLSQVLIDELTERQGTPAAALTAHPLQRSLERLARVPLGRETTPLHTSRAAATHPIT